MTDAFSYVAPGKVILFGEHFVVHGARAVMCAIDRRVVAESYGREGDALSVISALESADLPLRTPTESIPATLRPFHHLARSLGCRGRHAPHTLGDTLGGRPGLLVGVLRGGRPAPWPRCAAYPCRCNGCGHIRREKRIPGTPRGRTVPPACIGGSSIIRPGGPAGRSSSGRASRRI